MDLFDVEYTQLVPDGGTEVVTSPMIIFTSKNLFENFKQVEKDTPLCMMSDATFNLFIEGTTKYTINVSLFITEFCFLLLYA